MDHQQSDNIWKLFKEGINEVKSAASLISFSSIRVFNESEFRNLLVEAGNRGDAWSSITSAMDN